MSWRERLSETLPASRLPGSERFVTRRYLRPPDAETSHDDTASTTTTVTDTCDTWRRFTQAVPSGSNAHGATAVTMDVVSSAPTLLPQSAMQKKSSEGTSVESVPLLHRGGMSDISTPVGVPQNIWQRPELSVPSSSQNEARSTAHVSTPSETAQQPEPFAARQSMHAEAQRQQPLDGRDARQPRPSCAQGAMEQCTAVSVTFPLARLRALVRDGETFAQVMHTAGSSTQTFDFMDVVGRWRACATVLRDKTVNKDSATDDIHGPRSEKTSSSVAAAAAAIAANANKINDEDTSSADGMNCGPNGDGTVDDLAAASATSRQDRAPNTPQRTHAAILCDALLDAVSLEHLTIASAVERLLRERMTHEREVAGLREALVRAQKLATRRLAEMTADHASEMCRLRCRVEELEELQQKPRQEIAVAAVSTHAHTAGRGFMSNEGDTESMPHERGAQAAAAQTAAAAAADYSAECASATLPTHVDSMPNLSAHLGPDGCDACDAPCFSSSMSSPEPHTQHAIMGTMNAPSRLMNRHTHADDATMAHVTLDACDTFDDTHEEVRRRHTNVRSSSATQTELSLDYILAAVGAERDRTFRSTRRERENDLIALLVREVEGMRVQLTVAHAQLSTLEEQRHHFLGSVSSPLSFAERAAITHAAHAW